MCEMPNVVSNPSAVLWISPSVNCRTAFKTKCEMGGRSEEEKCVAKARMLEMEPRSKGWKVLSFFGRGSC